MIYSSISPNSRFFAAMTNALASAGSSKNARNSTVRRAVISFGAPSVDAVSMTIVMAQFPKPAHAIASSVARAWRSVMPSPLCRLEATQPAIVSA